MCADSFSQNEKSSKSALRPSVGRKLGYHLEATRTRSLDSALRLKKPVKKSAMDFA